MIFMIFHWIFLVFHGILMVNLIVNHGILIVFNNI